MKDLGNFTIPCSIGIKYSGKTLCDLGPSITFMPLLMFKQLGVVEVTPTTVTLQLANGSHVYLKGILKIYWQHKFIFSVDFIVWDFKADKEVSIILRRPFLTTGKTLIDVQKGKLTMRVNYQQVTFNMLDAMKSPDEVQDYNFVSVVDFTVIKRLNICCNKEEINVVTFKKVQDKDPEKANIVWLEEKQSFRTDKHFE